MNRSRIILLATALVMMALAGGIIRRSQVRQSLGPPGVRAEPAVDSKRWRIPLPEQVGAWRSQEIPVTEEELTALPADTSFGKRLYFSGTESELLLQVVMMGRDRTSIHKPQYCLTGQGWGIERTEEARIPMARPQAYELPVMRLTTSRVWTAPDGRSVPLRGIYVYWFVADGRLTARHWERMWWLGAELLRTGTLQRWAYVSVFVQCAPGGEAAAFERIQRFVQDAVPEFQLAGG